MNKKQFKDLISSKIVILDGATGTELIKNGMPVGVNPEQWVYENRDVIKKVQDAYRESGADIVYAPTFGANRLKLKNYNLEDKLFELNSQLAKVTKEAAVAFNDNRYVFGDIAPTGNFVEPFGELKFTDAVAVYQEQAEALVAGGVDGFAIETMMDIQEARAALIGVNNVAKKHDLPVMVTMTFEEDMRSLSGTDPISALITLQALGADAFGCNCSTGPDEMIKVIELLKPYATIPLVAKPNAGMPKLIDGETVFSMNAEEFGNFAEQFVNAGVNIYGGCCGTTPEHIKSVTDNIKNNKLQPIAPKITALSAVSSARGYTLMGPNEPIRIVGERINPTGKKALQAELRENKFNIVRQFAIEQEAKGATILDVNMGLSGVDEKELMRESIAMLSKSFSTPLCIDSTNHEVIEAALQLYPGRALVNSISAEKERIEKMLPIAAKYGAMIIVLPLTDAGITKTTQERIRVINDIYNEAKKYGYHREDLSVDALIMTISSNADAAKIALETINYVSNEFKSNTICGLSNVSFGLPERKWANSTFLAMAAAHGLNMAIANPNDELLMNILYSADALAMRDNKLHNYVKHFSNLTCNISSANSNDSNNNKTEAKAKNNAEIVQNCVLNGADDAIKEAIQKALDDGFKAKDLVDNYLIKGINIVGEKFERKEYFLPQLINSADAMRCGFEVLEPILAAEKSAITAKVAKVVFATVEGDIHDIGKNIVCLMLRNYNFDVIDLGKDVKAQTIIDIAVKEKADIIGLSALMTTTMTNMDKVVALAKQYPELDNVKFMVGGAVVDAEYAENIAAFYSTDAMDAVKVAKKLMGK